MSQIYSPKTPSPLSNILAPISPPRSPRHSPIDRTQHFGQRSASLSDTALAITQRRHPQYPILTIPGLAAVEIDPRLTYTPSERRRHTPTPISCPPPIGAASGIDITEFETPEDIRAEQKHRMWHYSKILQGFWKSHGPTPETPPAGYSTFARHTPSAFPIFASFWDQDGKPPRRRGPYRTYKKSAPLVPVLIPTTRTVRRSLRKATPYPSPHSRATAFIQVPYVEPTYKPASPYDADEEAYFSFGVDNFTMSSEGTTAVG
jgi:hypothetical protein